MTAERQDGRTARRRVSDTRRALSRGLVVPAEKSVPAAVVPESPASAEVTPAATAQKGSKPQMSKYTALLDGDTAAEFDGLALAARRKLGRRVDKSEVMKALIRLAADDASLRDQMIGQLGPELERRG